MQIVATTPLAVLIAVAVLWLGPIRGLWILLATMPFGGSAAFIAPAVGNVSLTDAALVAMWLSLVWRGIGPGRLVSVLTPGSPGLPLFLLLVVATIGAMFLPRIFFHETDVFVVTRAGGQSSIRLADFGPSGSNLGQLLRLVLSTSVFFLLAAVFSRDGSGRTVMRAMLVATLVHVALSVLDLASSMFGLRGLLDGIRTAAYATADDQMLFGFTRLNGGFPEPSSFGYYTIGLYAFWLRFWFVERRSRLSGLMVFLTAALVIRSTSTSALVTFAIYTWSFLVWHLRDISVGSRASRVAAVLLVSLPALVGLSVLAYSLLPVLRDTLDLLVVSKLSSSSGVERMSWNTQAWTNFVDSYGLGLGIGSVRASSWVMSNLGNLGLAGTMLQAWFLWSLYRLRPDPRLSAGPDRAQANVAVALLAGGLAVLLQAVFSKPFPNLDTPFYAMAGIAVGLMRQTARQGAGRSLGDVPARTVRKRRPVVLGKGSGHA